MMEDSKTILTPLLYVNFPIFNCETFQDASKIRNYKITWQRNKLHIRTKAFQFLLINCLFSIKSVKLINY